MKRSELFFSFLLLPVDAVAILAAFLIAYTLRIKVDVLPASGGILLSDYLWSGIYLLPAWILFFALAGMYNIERYKNYFNLLYRIFIISSAAILLLIVFIFLYKISFFSRLILIYTWGLSIVFIFLARVIVESVRTFLFRYNIGVRRALCIGANEITQKIIYKSNHDRSLGIKVVGVLNGKSNNFDLKIIGRIDEFEKIIKKERIDEVFLTDMSIPESTINHLILNCSANNITFRFIPNFFYLITSNVVSKQLAGLPIMEVKGTPLDGWGRILKRIIDIIMSLIALIVLTPLGLISALAVVLNSRGPVFYSHDRVGRDGKKFKLHKFRSMYADKCDYSQGGKDWTQQNDPRITPVGKFLRKTNIDEIPQLFNVLRGDMSIVGPRPEQPTFVEKFQKEIPEYFQRHRVKSGITGWAQVNGLKGDTSVKQRVDYDIFYIENWGLWLDIKIMIMTAGLIIKEILGGKYEYRHHS